jgi:hypothetical protein
VKVSLEVLGYDQCLSDDLEHFRGVVVDRYYQLVTRSPLFTVDFGGTIRIRKIKIYDSLPFEDRCICPGT